MEAIDQLEQSLTELLERYRQLREENHELRLTITDQKENLIAAYAEIKSLRDQNHKLLIARGLGETDETREAAKQQLTRIIHRIDTALEVLQR